MTGGQAPLGSCRAEEADVETTMEARVSCADPFTDDERDRLIMALAHGSAPGGFTAEDAKRVMDWAYEAAVAAALLRLVLSDRVYLKIAGGEVCFVSPDSPE